MFLIQRNEWIAVLRAIAGILQMFIELLKHLSMMHVWAVGLAPPGFLKANFQEGLQHQMEKVCGMMETSFLSVLRALNTFFLMLFESM